MGGVKLDKSRSMLLRVKYGQTLELGLFWSIFMFHNRYQQYFVVEYKNSIVLSNTVEFLGIPTIP